MLPPAFGEAGKASEDGKEVAWVFGSASAPTNYEFGKKMFLGITKLLESGDLKVCIIPIVMSLSLSIHVY